MAVRDRSSVLICSRRGQRGSCVRTGDVFPFIRNLESDAAMLLEAAAAVVIKTTTPAKPSRANILKLIN